MINLLKQSAWTSVITNSASIITFLGTIILARFISPETFGVYAFCYAAKEIISCLCAPSLSQTYLFSSGTKNDLLKVLKINFFFSICLAIGTLLAGYLIFFKYGTQYFYIILIFGLLSILNNFSSIFLAIGEKQMNFKKTSLVRSSALIISLVITCIFALILGDKVLVLVLKEILFSVILICASYIFFFRKKNFKNLNKTKKTSSLLLKYSLRSYLPRISEVLSYKIFEMLTANILGKNILGLFYQGLNLVRTPYRFLGSITDNILFVHLKKIDKKQRTDDFSSIQNLILILIIPILLTFNLFSYEIVNIILGKKWLKISEILGLLSMFLVILPFYNSLITVFQASDNQRYYTSTNILVLVFQIIGIFVMPKNISSFIFAYCGSFLIGSIYLTLFITKNNGFNLRKIIKTLFSIILILISISFYHIFNLSIMLFLIFFLWILLIYKNKNIITLILKKWKN
jgi:O-antigen/teichoic acid export membrane protein